MSMKGVISSTEWRDFVCKAALFVLFTTIEKFYGANFIRNDVIERRGHIENKTSFQISAFQPF